MLTTRKLVANRRNARKSTGPRTADGKAAASRNAIRYGLFCRQAVLPGENATLFFALRDDYIKSLQPQDAVELALVERILAEQWRLMRLDEAEIAEYGFNRIERGHDNEAPTEYAGITMCHVLRDPDAKLEQLDRMRQRLQNSISRAMRQLDVRHHALTKDGSKLPRSPYWVEDDDYDTIEAIADAAELDKQIIDDNDDDDDADEADEQDEPEVDEPSKMKNEPTAEESVATSTPAGVCDETPCSSSSTPRVDRDAGGAATGEACDPGV